MTRTAECWDIFRTTVGNFIIIRAALEQLYKGNWSGLRKILEKTLTSLPCKGAMRRSIVLHVSLPSAQAPIESRNSKQSPQVFGKWLKLHYALSFEGPLLSLDG